MWNGKTFHLAEIESARAYTKRPSVCIAKIIFSLFTANSEADQRFKYIVNVLLFYCLFIIIFCFNLFLLVDIFIVP